MHLGVLAPRKLSKANAHRFIGLSCFLAHTPSKIDWLELESLGSAGPPKYRKNFALEDLPLGLHITEGGANK
jgi:hypothetical protein